MPTLTRRDFLKISFTAGGALLVTACAPNVTETLAPIATSTSTPLPEIPFQPNLFIKIDQDGTVTLTIHRTEMGQGVRTSLAMILAEELEADWSKVRVEQSPANGAIGNQITGGSGSIADHYLSLREAGATAKMILITAAANFFGVPVTECKAEQSTVIHTSTDQKISYGELVNMAQDIELTEPVELKDPSEFRLIGKSMPRIDDPDIVTGKAIYGSDVILPNMLHAVVARCPVPNGTVVDFDDEQTRLIAGVVDVVQVNTGIAVIAQNTWAAIQGRNVLKVTWDEGSYTQYSSESIREELVDAVNTAIANETSQSLTTIEAIYETTYLAHAAMEPVTCVADVRADGCDIWAGTQNPQDVKAFVQQIVNVPTNVYVTLLGGGFGRMLEVDYAIEAAEISQAIAAPVKVTWTRDDDIQHDFYRQPTYHWMRAGWDNDGELNLWRHYMAGPGLNGIAYRVGREVLEEGITSPYQIRGRIAQAFLVNIPLPTGPWRAVMAGPNAFANECFFDEIANGLKRDPYELRMELLPDNSTLRSTLQLVTEKSNWSTPPTNGIGRGIACHAYHNTAVAMVAEVSVENSIVKIHKVFCAINCGRVIHPDMVAQQMEGSIVFGLTSLLKNEITIEQGRVKQSTYVDYPILQMSEMPEIEVHIVPDDRNPTGTGEMGVPPIVSAVVNAIYAVTGKRIRHMPIREDDL